MVWFDLVCFDLVLLTFHASLEPSLGGLFIGGRIAAGTILLATLCETVYSLAASRIATAPSPGDGLAPFAIL